MERLVRRRSRARTKTLLVGAGSGPLTDSCLSVPVHGKAPQHWGCRGAFRVASELGVFEATEKQTYRQVRPSATCIFAGPACTGAGSDQERATAPMRPLPILPRIKLFRVTLNQ